jgi:hypothetical protein
MQLIDGPQRDRPYRNWLARHAAVIIAWPRDPEQYCALNVLKRINLHRAAPQRTFPRELANLNSMLANAKTRDPDRTRYADVLRIVRFN